VYHRGAFFYVGDGHARQGDGEGLGSGVETSLDVQFTVRVHKKMGLSIPRLENAESIISIASQAEFSSSMDQAVRAANSDLIRWLMTGYGLTMPEAHLLMGGAVEHKIATYFGTVTASMPKRYLPKR
jgi:acetamidase/formamidase